MGLVGGLCPKLYVNFLLSLNILNISIYNLRQNMRISILHSVDRNLFISNISHKSWHWSKPNLTWLNLPWLKNSLCSTKRIKKEQHIFITSWVHSTGCYFRRRTYWKWWKFWMCNTLFRHQRSKCMFNEPNFLPQNALSYHSSIHREGFFWHSRRANTLLVQRNSAFM